MPRIIAIDYGTKRVGVAVTDPGKIIATGLETVHSKDIIAFLKDYFVKEEVERIVVGQPVRMDGKPSSVTGEIEKFIRALKKNFPLMPVDRMDERFTSSMAKQALIASGVKKKQRQDKALVDLTSAIIILQSYLEKKH